MDLSAYDFNLPEELIALRPVRPRPSARLLVAGTEGIDDRHFHDLPALLRPDDLLIFNDTKVIPARLFGVRHRATTDGSGIAKVDVTLIERSGPSRWRALARPAKRLKTGDRVMFGALAADVEARDAAEVTLVFNKEGPGLDAAVAQEGAMPLPPYIAQRRPADERDRDDYQTILAAKEGAVAAPTASLHFDASLLAALDAAGVSRALVTLHVGAGTFLPVRDEQIEAKRLHGEWGEITPAAADAMNKTKRAGGRLIPVGTTALRLMESAAAEDGTIRPFRGETEIFIMPGYRFRAVSGLITNFHLPRSTLFMLVSALMGRERMQALYAHAVAERYRFYSYGDGSLLLPNG